MIRVLHIITTLGMGGIERWLISMLGQIPKTECSMDVCCKGSSLGSLAPLAQQKGAQVHRCQLRVTQVGYIKSLRTLVKSGRYDIVHNHLQAYSGLPVYACRPLGIPIITSFHATEFPPETWLRYPGIRSLREAYAKRSVHYALRHSTIITGCSQGVVDCVHRNYNVDADGWRVLPYGVDLPPLPTQAEKRELRRSFGWPETTPIVVHVGRFAEQKNHPGLLQTFQSILQFHPDAKLLLIGGGELRPEVEKMTQELGLTESVRFLGCRNDVPALVSRSSLFLFPSWFEGLPVAVLEASAAGVPVVASKVPGVTEAIQDRVTGFLFAPTDIEGMSGAASRLLSDAALANQIGLAGRERIIQNFSEQASARNLLNLYRECTRQH